MNQKKYALVTGGNKGIGFTICEGLLKSGFEVILAARSLDKAKDAINWVPLWEKWDNQHQIFRAQKEQNLMRAIAYLATYTGKELLLLYTDGIRIKNL